MAGRPEGGWQEQVAHPTPHLRCDPPHQGEGKAAHRVEHSGTEPLVSLVQSIGQSGGGEGRRFLLLLPFDPTPARRVA